ncbi:hypothetical protein OHA25_07410 [Nonomuraea sp. NBC_00507]|uniref:hypothetical protein n=1 Tax=Nonomuraea sp. NBC_00507 TaxID=2976002 RepID=UPI002E190E77
MDNDVTEPDVTEPDVTEPDVLDKRFTWGLILEVFQVLTSHGYLRHSHHATGAAVGTLGELCRVYEGHWSGCWACRPVPARHAGPTTTCASPACPRPGAWRTTR